MRTYHIQNFGCRASQADGAALEGLLRANGMAASPLEQNPDLILLNTCTVTSSADADARASIRKLHREHPAAQIVVTGCYAQRAPEELARIDGVAGVFGNSEKHRIADVIGRVPYHGGVVCSAFTRETPVLSTPLVEAAAGRARPNLKIQDGCGNKCAFCVIPEVRGPSRFVPADQVIKQVRGLAERYREIVLTGINLGRWGRAAGSDSRLAGLVRRLLNETAVGRLRISSVEPMDWTGELIDLVAREERIARHVHMPLQSGSDSVLKRMRRKYRMRHYADRINRLHRAMPDAAFGADVMTGFPGETEAEFQESISALEELPFTYLHVFTYSERPGTEAARMPGSVPIRVRRERTHELRAWAEKRERAFRVRMIGQRLSAVTLEERPWALTSNFVRVALEVWPGANVMVSARPAALTPGGVRESGAMPVLR